MHSFFIAMDAWGDRQNWAFYGKIATVVVIYFWLVSLIGTALKRNREAMEANETLINDVRRELAVIGQDVQDEYEQRPFALDVESPRDAA